MTETPEAPKRKVGRPKGLGKVPGSGRQRGTSNRTNQITRDYIVREGAPVDFLCKVVRGRRFSVADKPGDGERAKQYPTLDQRLAAARILASKIVPDLKSVEHAGEDGGDLIIRILRFGDNAA